GDRSAILLALRTPGTRSRRARATFARVLCDLGIEGGLSQGVRGRVGATAGGFRCRDRRRQAAPPTQRARPPRRRSALDALALGARGRLRRGTRRRGIRLAARSIALRQRTPEHLLVVEELVLVRRVRNGAVAEEKQIACLPADLEQFVEVRKAPVHEEGLELL